MAVSRDVFSKWQWYETAALSRIHECFRDNFRSLGDIYSKQVEES